ncbi:uncharacterized protein LOC141748736 [Larus michahellis]|uniref:uncharacterized protein LOC141748736 n=1 Tax=Larus michahellis TaxID=119627 RepID=UPI003D9B7FE5
MPDPSPPRCPPLPPGARRRAPAAPSPHRPRRAATARGRPGRGRRRAHPAAPLPNTGRRLRGLARAGGKNSRLRPSPAAGLPPPPRPAAGPRDRTGPARRCPALRATPRPRAELRGRLRYRGCGPGPRLSLLHGAPGPVIAFEGSQGLLTVPGGPGTPPRLFAFSLSRCGRDEPQGSFECVRLPVPRSQPWGFSSKPGSVPGPAALSQAQAGADTAGQARQGTAAAGARGGRGGGSHCLLLPWEGDGGGPGAGGLAGEHGPGAAAGCPTAAQETELWTLSPLLPGASAAASGARLPVGHRQEPSGGEAPGTAGFLRSKSQQEAPEPPADAQQAAPRNSGPQQPRRGAGEPKEQGGDGPWLGGECPVPGAAPLCPQRCQVPAQLLLLSRDPGLLAQVPHHLLGGAALSLRGSVQHQLRRVPPPAHACRQRQPQVHSAGSQNEDAETRNEGARGTRSYDFARVQPLQEATTRRRIAVNTCARSCLTSKA